jgi:Protein of unknown function (DUF3306)
MTDAPSGRLARWSQRKAAARRGDALLPEADDAVAGVAPAEDQQPLDAAPEAANAATDSNAAEVGEDIPDLPPIEELTFQSDYTVFMKRNVPETLKRAALRKLWRSDPILANLDGLNDYDEDYNLVDTAITAAQTAYKVGKGYLDEIGEKLAQLEEAKVVESGELPDSQTKSVAHDGASDGTSDGFELVDDPGNAVVKEASPEDEHGTANAPEDGGKQ